MNRIELTTESDHYSLVLTMCSSSCFFFSPFCYTTGHDTPAPSVNTELDLEVELAVHQVVRVNTALYCCDEP